MSLSELAVRNAKPPAVGQITLWDGLPNFGLRISQGGTKSWIVLIGRQRRRVTIGRYPIISLADARTEAKRLLAQHTLGKHRPHSISFKAAVEQYDNTHLTTLRPRTKEETLRLLKRHFETKWKHDKLEDISPSEIAEVIDKLPTPSIATHAFAALRGFLRWAKRRNYLSQSPMDGMRPTQKPPSRSRVLSLEEIGKVYRASGDKTMGRITKLLILTGARRSEIGSLRGEYINRKKRTLELPQEATKQKREHVIPLGKRALAILRTAPERGYVFPAKGKDTPFDGWSKMKPKVAIPHWTLHDLRRSFSTHISSFGVLPHIVERLLGHSTGTLTPIAQVYNKYSYLKEARAAISLWEKKLGKVLFHR